MQACKGTPGREIAPNTGVNATKSFTFVTKSGKILHSPILHYISGAQWAPDAFSSWMEKTVTKTIHCHWENRFVLQKYGAVWKFLPKRFSKINPRQTSSLSLFPKRSTCISIDN